MKYCPGCKQTLPLTDFTFKDKAAGIIADCCKACRRIGARRSYQKNKKQVVQAVRDRNVIRRDWSNRFRSLRGCCNCSENDASCLDLHHLSGDQKLDNVSVLMVKASKQRIVDEMNKCVVICSNCHRKLHAGVLILPTDVPHINITTHNLW